LSGKLQNLRIQEQEHEQDHEHDHIHDHVHDHELEAMNQSASQLFQSSGPSRYAEDFMPLHDEKDD